MFAVTERLLLRPGWADDAPALYAALSDEAVTMKLAQAPWPYRLADAQAFLALPRTHGEASFLIFDRHRGSAGLIGGIGIHDQDGEPEIGYWIARDHWGKGYATEAGRAVLQIAKHTLRYPRLVSGHFVDNPASGAVLRKLGFHKTGMVEPRTCAARRAEVPCVLMALNFEDSDMSQTSAMRTQQMQMMLAA
jgi:RimJ/RimL family protein N-acetyltransferase